MLLSPSTIFSNYVPYDYYKFNPYDMYLFCPSFTPVDNVFVLCTIKESGEIVKIALIYLDVQLNNAKHMLS